MSAGTGTSAPVVGGEDYWSRVARVHAVDVSASGLAKVLGVQAATVSHYVRNPPAGFPFPAERKRRYLWSLAQGYQYLRDHKPLQANTIPRFMMVGDGAAVGGALFEGADRFAGHLFRGVRGVTPLDEFVVHYWRPADGGSSVAVLYPAGPGHRIGRQWAVEVAAIAARHFRRPVAVVTDELRAAAEGAMAQGAVVVAEMGDQLRCPPGCESPHLSAGMRGRGVDVVSAYEIGWFDMAYLLRTDVPWWPPALRDVEAMLRWVPGGPVEQLVPEDARYRHWAIPMLTDALESSTALGVSVVRDLLGRADRRIQRGLYPRNVDVADVPGGVAAPGIVQAAVAKHSEGSDACFASAEVGLLLRQTYPDHLPQVNQTMGCLWSLDEVGACMGELRKLTQFDEPGPLCQEWMNRLEPVRDRMIGHVLLEERARITRGEPLADPFNPSCWVVRDLANPGAMVFSVASSQPARGLLVDFERGNGYDVNGFYRDSEGLVWPLPVSVPVSGEGPAEYLAQIVLALSVDASADVSRIRKQRPVPPELGRLVQQLGPWSLSDSEVGALLHQLPAISV